MIKISVEQKHIDKGVPGKGSFCPIALAIKDTMLSYDYVMVTPYKIFVSDGVKHLPIRARIFVSKFDKHKPVKPFKFYLKASL